MERMQRHGGIFLPPTFINSFNSSTTCRRIKVKKNYLFSIHYNVKISILIKEKVTLFAKRFSLNFCLY